MRLALRPSLAKVSSRQIEVAILSYVLRSSVIKGFPLTVKDQAEAILVNQIEHGVSGATVARRYHVCLLIQNCPF